MPKVSVCVPIYNVEKYIDKCVRSLFEQTLDDIEYIFVNDCTPDKSMDILRQVLVEYPQRQEQVKIIDHKVNKGLPAVRNTCLSVGTGEYIVCCDSDDWVEPDMFSEMYRKAKEDNADIVCCNYVAEYSRKRVFVTYPYLEETKKILQKLSPSVLNSSLCNKLVRKDLYERYAIRPFEGINMNEDLGQTLRLRYLSRKTVIVPKAFYHYNKLNEASMTASSSLRYEEERVQCARLLENWFASQPDWDSYKGMINNVKFAAKAGLFYHPALKNLDRWKNTFPETNKYIWQNREISFYDRFAMWLGLHHGGYIAYFMYKIAKPILRVFKHHLQKLMQFSYK